MIKFGFWSALLIALAVLDSPTAAAADNLPARRDGAKPFALVELFTSQGCSSCPPADQYLRDITTHARKNNLRIFTIGFHVDYWDYLGWRDPYGSSKFSQRQRQYARQQQSSTVYTPQMIVNGMEAFGGFRREQGKRAIDKALKAEPRTRLQIVSARKNKNKLSVKFEVVGQGSADVLNIALVERGILTDVRRGENAGLALSHENSVRQFISLPIKAKAGEVALELPKDVNLNRSSVVGYVQDTRNMLIKGANILDLGLGAIEN